MQVSRGRDNGAAGPSNVGVGRASRSHRSCSSDSEALDLGLHPSVWGAGHPETSSFTLFRGFLG